MGGAPPATQRARHLVAKAPRCPSCPAREDTISSRHQSPREVNILQELGSDEGSSPKCGSYPFCNASSHIRITEQGYVSDLINDTILKLVSEAWFDPWCGHDKICAAVGPLRKALNPTLLQGVCLLLSLINCKSLWIKASAK